MAQSKYVQEDSYEYLMVIPPDQETSSRVMKIKKAFHTRYGCSFASRSYPHITLLKFILQTSLEERIVSSFTRISELTPTFEIVLADFGTFSTNTIYLKIKDPGPVVALARNLRQAFSARPAAGVKHKLISHKLYFTRNHPHMTVARKMTPSQHEQAWPDWAHESFDARFPAVGMRLLKRPGSGAPYAVVREFPFAQPGAGAESKSDRKAESKGKAGGKGKWDGEQTSLF